jgi:GH35 family endo-1,4-beta-xylanase
VAAAPAVAPAAGTGGFLRDWAIAAPFETTELDEPAVAPEFAAYPGLLALDRFWLPARAGEDGRLDLRALFAQPPQGTAILHTYFEVPADGKYLLRVGSDDAVRIDIDGRTVHRHDVRRPWQPDQDEAAADLAKGWHRMLLRVVDYGAQWAVSVRVADAAGRPVDLRHQAEVPKALAAAVYGNEPVTLPERARVALRLAEEAARVKEHLAAARGRLAALPEGYVTFAEYQGARDQGGQFFGALSALWDAISAETIDTAALGSAEKAALAAAGALSPGLVPETRRLVSDMAAIGRVWERLGRTRLARPELAEATREMAALLARSRRLADRVETEHILMARLENDIRNWRQRNLTIRVVDAEGGPVENAEVEVVQTRHDFLFGGNLFAFGRWGDARQEDQYRQRFARLFNYATVPFYWSGLETAAGGADYGASDRAIEWAAKHGIAVRAHPLLWREALPLRLEKMKPDDGRRAVEAHVRRTAERYRDRVLWWDVLTDPAPDGSLGPARVGAAEAFHWVAQARPRGRLALDGPDAQRLVRQAAEVRAAGAPLDAVSIQAHQHAGAWPMETARQVLDRAAEGRLPVHVSAVTILGGPSDEAAQAEAVRRFYTAAFAHPAVASITWWDLSDKFAWKNAPAGLVRADLSPKPAYAALDRLLNHLWRTDAAGRTGEDGRITVRAFFGRYRITAHTGGRKKTLDLDLPRDGDRDLEVALPAGK